MSTHQYNVHPAHLLDFQPPFVVTVIGGLGAPNNVSNELFRGHYCSNISSDHVMRLPGNSSDCGAIVTSGQFEVNLLALICSYMSLWWLFMAWMTNVQINQSFQSVSVLFSKFTCYSSTLELFRTIHGSCSEGNGLPVTGAMLLL